MKKKLSIERIYSLTSLQEGLLYHSMLNPGSPSYIQQLCLQIDGKLNYDYVNEAYRYLVEKYDVMRTIFKSNVGKNPLQIVVKERKAEIVVVKEGTMTKEEFLEKDLKRGFNLEKDILFRVTVLECGEKNYQLIFTYHHIILDGWCIGIVIKDFLQYYKCRVENVEMKEDTVFPYANYIGWLEQQDKQKTIDYWTDYLQNYEQKVTIPMYNKDSSDGSIKTWYEFDIENSIMEQATKLCKNYNSTLSSLFQTVWGIVLQKYNNCDDVVFGVVVSGRNVDVPGADEMVGLFVNTIPARVHNQDATCAELLQSVQKTSLESLQYSYASLSEVQSKTKLKNELINNILIFENYPVQKEIENLNDNKLFGFNIKGVDAREQSSYDLNIYVIPGETVTVKIAYNAEAYSETAVKNIGGHLVQCLKNIIANPDQPVHSLNIITENEKKLIDEVFNHSELDFDRNTIMVDIIEAKIKEQPDKVAIVCNDRTLTYQELNYRANGVARYLKAKSVGKDDIVGVYLDRTEEIFVTLLGILKTGAAYLPIDSKLPEERIAYMLENSQAKVVVTKSSICKENIATKYAVVNLDKDNWQECQTEDNLGLSIDPHDLYYVLYTSGSTGRPKGVMIEHGSVANYRQSLFRMADYEKHDVMLCITSISFDIFMSESLMALSKGMKIVLADDNEVQDTSKICDLMEKYQVDIMQATPSRLKLLLNQPKFKDSVKSIRDIMVLGEMFPVDTLRSFSAISNARVLNMYGPTETTVFSTGRDVTNVEKMTIGYPATNTEISILDEYQNEQPIGVLGELCIGGAGVARGYINNAAQDAERFITAKDGKRFYRTGDLACWLPDGDIELAGRIDFQVKIRGYRIELEEIEHLLSKFSGIEENVVVSKVRPDGEIDLCAYVAGSEKIDFSKVREYLGTKLPDYMVPTYYMQLDKIPLNASGKVDRRKLPELSEFYCMNKQEMVLPETETEKKLANIWKTVLSIEQVGINTGFRELGGHSIQMLKVINGIQNAFQITIELEELVENDTVKALAAVLDQKLESGTKDTVETYEQIQHDESDMYEEFPLTEIQMAYLLGRNYQNENGTTHIYSELSYNVEAERLNQAVNHVIRRHPMLRTVFSMDGKQRILPEVPVYNIVCHDLRGEKPVQQQAFLLKEREHINNGVFNPEQWPLFEVEVVEFSDDERYILLCIDMLIADGSSIQIILSEVKKYYQNPEVVLVEPGINFRDYMLAYSRLRNSNVYKQDKEFWVAKAADFPEAPRLPYVCDPKNVSNAETKRLSAKINRDDWSLLKNVCMEYKISPSVFLLGAYSKVLSFWSNQEKFALDLTVFNRYRFHKDVDAIVGDFTSVLLMDIDFTEKKRFLEHCIGINKNLLQAIGHRHFEGVEFIRELSMNNASGEQVLIPVVFTSMLMEDRAQEQAVTEDHIHFSSSKTSQVYLDNQIMETPEGINISWDYVQELFDENTISFMFEQFNGLIQAAIHGNADSYQMMSEKDQQLIKLYNSTAKEIETDTLDHLFEMAAEKYPEKEAVVFENERISYSELDKRSNQIAAYLREQGIRCGNYVGLIGSREPATIANILGILKAGAAYVPMNPDYPEDRIANIMAQIQGTVCLKASDYKEKNIASYSCHKLEKTHSKDNVAYIIFTSGSTGVPKGVVISHKAAVNTILDINEKYDVTDEDRIIGISSMSFDLSVYDIFGSLSTGATLVQVADQRDLGKLYETIEKEEITIWNSVPAIMELMLDSQFGETENYWAQSRNMNKAVQKNDSLRVVLLSGDWIPLTLPEKIMENYMNAEVVSLGGATEAAIWSIYYPIEEVEKDWSSIPYGMPLANQQIYILNYERNICPIGVEGEIFIGGDGVAECYFGDEEKTNAAFIQHEELGRLYCTGDYGVMKQEGYVEFHGRKDDQVKVRGYRIELGEIEKKLCDLVQNATVMIRDDSKRKKYICAYYVNDTELDNNELRENLERSLPEYMIPNVFVKIDEIPLSANGKVDKKRLPEPEVEENRLADYEAPETETEKQLCQIWEEVLGVESIGRNDNYFELGGNSILMIQIRARISRAFGVEVDFKEFLKRNTVSRMAAFIDAQEKQEEEFSYPSVEPDTAHRYEPFPLTEVQMAYLMGRNEEFEMGGISTHVYTEIETQLDNDRLQTALNKMIVRHEALRTVIEPGGEQRIIEDVGTYQIAYDDLSAMDEDSKEKFVLDIRSQMSHQVFDSAVWPLFAFRMVKLSEEKKILFVGMDILIADGASTILFERELMQYYNNEDLVLPELNFNFRDYVLAFKELKEKKIYKVDKEFWLKKVDIFPQAPQLPMKQSSKLVHNPHFIRKRKVFTQEQWSGVKAFCKEKNITQAAVLYTVYAKVLSYWSNQNKLAINTTVFNRCPFHKDVNDIMGDFTTVMLIDIDFKAEQNFLDSAREAQINLFDALEHRHYDGIEFIRELSRHNGTSGQAIMPIVFTSMLFGDANNQKVDTMGEVVMSVSQTPQVFLDNQVSEKNGELLVTWDYVQELYDSSMIDKMYDMYIGLIENVANGIEDNEQTLCEEDKKFIESYNKTEEVIETNTLDYMFEMAANQYPDREAVVFGEDRVTYRELDTRSNQVAAYLKEQGVKCGDYVGLIGSRVPKTIVNVLGILKAGAAYVPMNPDYPDDCIRYIMEKSQANICLRAEDYDTKNMASYSSERVEKSHTKENVAYTIFTSGSTGVPKGVVISHQAACNTILDINRKYDVTEEDRFIGVSSMSFDLSVYDIFGSLMAGATLVQVEDQRDMKKLYETVEQEEITIWNSVPAIMELMLDSNAGGDEAYWQQVRNMSEVSQVNDTLRVVLLSGDWIPLSLPEKIVENYMNAEVISLGGATEAAIWSIYYPIEEVEKEWSSIPYGMPLANQQIYILNYKKEICPVGVEGEILIGGEGVAECYLGDKEKTEAAFIMHETLGRLYCTGDYGVMKKEGYVEFRGRKDDQVKIRGYRIELGEIEEKLGELVQNTAVMVREDAKRKKYICAYYVNDTELDTAILREQLEKSLPEYMIPNVFVKIDEIPLSANGKVDKKRLPEPAADDSRAGEYEAPETETEKEMCKIWEDVLGNNRIGRNDNYFELGGNSILMIQIRTRISRHFGVEVDFKEFLKRNTVAKMSAYVESQEKKIEEFAYPSVEPDVEHRYEPFPLTEVQMAYLMGRNEEFEMGGISTHVYMETETDMDLFRFRKAVQKVIDRHDMLRAIIMDNGEQQILQDVPPYEMVIEDLRGLSKEEQEQRIVEERNRMSHHIFKTDEWPLFEFKALRLEDQVSELMIGIDMLITDGASIQMMSSELVRYYENPDLAEPEIKFSFRDYVLANNEFKKKSFYEADKKYWMDRISDFSNAPELPLRIKPSEVGKPKFNRQTRFFQPEVWQKVKASCKKHNVTEAALLSCIYAEVLSFWSNQKNLVLNTTVFNRLPFHNDIQKMLGDFTSTMLLDIRLDEKAGFWGKVEDVQGVLFDALEHRHYDGIEFIRELTKYRGTSGQALMPVVFTSMLFGKGEETTVSSTVKEAVSQTSQVYLDYQVLEMNNGLQVTWDYVDQLFDPDMIRCMFAQYTGILQSIADDVEEIELNLTEEDRKLIQSYNETEEAVETDTLDHMFELAADQYPDREAVVFGEDRVTYRDLDARSNQVASYLREQGVKCGDFVGLIGSREPKTIVNVLGILKAGAAYVPMNPDYPEDRICYIMEKSQANICLRAEDYDAKNIASYSRERAEKSHTKDNVAYTIFTSGSTGVPKGVVISHKAACNTILDINRKYDVTEEDRFIGVSSMSFDLSVYDIFGSLAAGATLVQVEDQRDMKKLYETVEQEEITIWNSVPAIMELMLDSNAGNDAAYWQQGRNMSEVAQVNDTLRVVLLSGDWIPLTLPEKIVENYMNAEVVSLGGATEASIWSIYYPIEEVENNWSSIPYGMPLANQTIYIMNYKKEICPVGVEGEIFIGGDGVAEGYLGDKEKTDAAFIMHETLGRLYCTGDYGIVKKDGYVEFRGRKDDQVKVRGYRIELGEIEEKLCDMVQNAAVMVREDAKKKKFICAYYVNDTELETGMLREQLAKSLPEYMIPNVFVKIDEIPLSANGKVDKKRLPEPEADESRAAEYEAPETETEKQMCKIWEDVLGNDRIGRNDNYFELGGNSILMIQIRTRISRQFGVEVGFKEFLKRNTVAKMSEYVASQERGTEEEFSYPVAEPDFEHRYEPFPLTEVQMAYLMGRNEEFEMGGISTHVYMESETDMDLNRFRKALQKVIDRHDMLRAVIMDNGQQKILENVPPYDMVIEDLREMSKEQQEDRILEERDRMSQHIFKTDEWPLFEFKAFQLNDKDNCFMVGLDMLIADGASIQKFSKELLWYYKEQDKDLKKLDFSFRDYVNNNEIFKQSDMYKRDKEFWMERMDTMSNAPALPLRMQPSDLKNPVFNRCINFFAEEEWGKIKSVCQKNNITEAALLCSVYAKVLSYWSNQQKMVINTTVFNRIPFHKDVDDIIGDFTSTMLLDIDVNDGENFWDQLHNMQDVLFDGLEHRHYDGVEFIRELSKYRGMNGQAIMPIVFTSMLFGRQNDMDSDFNSEVKKSLSQTSQVYLDYQVLELNGGLQVTWDYVEQLFDPDMIQSMFAQYIGILKDVADGVEAIEIEMKEEDKAFIQSYNDTEEAIETETLDYLFETAADQYPDREAVVFGNNRVTYRELDARSNQVAAYLREQGVKSGEYVGLIGSREPMTIANVLGILKAGAAYVPMNPDYPDDRIHYIMEKSQAMICLRAEDYEVKNIQAYSSERVEKCHTKDNVAYTIFTSGSTGVPKGVVISHKAACNTILDINRKYDVTEEDRIIGVSSMSFDLSVYDVFGSLIAGATLVQVEDQRDMKKLYETVDKEEITIWNSVPAIMELMLDSNVGNADGAYWQQGRNMSEAAQVNDTLRVVLLSGDWIPLSLPEKIVAKYMDAEVVSLGGATEAAIWSIYYPVEEVEKGWSSIPYGMPLANQQIYILNYRKEICPIGVEGEIFIGGYGVAEGYLGDKEKTEAAFINHETLGRLYCTGDYGIMRKEGYVEFRGRKDDQVKVRGYRIELGEIEEKLCELVQNAAVMVREDAKKKKYICAYYVNDMQIETGILREQLEKRLPEYMIPNVFTKIDEIPLSANGKVDKKRLPEPDEDTATEVYYAPENDLQVSVQKIWMDILGIEKLSVKANIMESGASSLDIMAFVSKAYSETGIEISIRDVLKQPSVEGCAKVITLAAGDKYAHDFMQLSINNTGNFLFCLPPISSFGIEYVHMSNELLDYTVYSFNYIVEDDRIEQYVKRIKELQEEGSYTLIGHSAGGTLAMKIAEYMEQHGELVKAVILLDSHVVHDDFKQDVTEDEYRLSAELIIDNLLARMERLQTQAEFIKNYFVPRIVMYYKYLKEEIVQVQIKAPVYVIKAEDSNIEHLEKWQSRTTGAFHIVEGKGKHNDMLLPGYVEENAKLIQELLK